jgi:endonuclease/exonuclease/phosphatase family metal-dependent hydrolase
MIKFFKFLFFLISNDSIIDCFVRAGVQWPLCTTWSGRRIDFLFVRGDITVSNPFWLPCTSSDHIPVSFDAMLE